jgi:hypothetical protein
MFFIYDFFRDCPYGRIGVKTPSPNEKYYTGVPTSAYLENTSYLKSASRGFEYTKHIPWVEGMSRRMLLPCHFGPWSICAVGRSVLSCSSSRTLSVTRSPFARGPLLSSTNDLFCSSRSRRVAPPSHPRMVSLPPAPLDSWKHKAETISRGCTIAKQKRWNIYIYIYIYGVVVLYIGHTLQEEIISSRTKGKAGRYIQAAGDKWGICNNSIIHGSLF